MAETYTSQNSSLFNASSLEFLNRTAETVSTRLDLNEWGDLLVGPYNQTESEEWQREYVRQYHLRHRNDPEVKYAVIIFYLIMVSPSTTSIRTVCDSWLSSSKHVTHQVLQCACCVSYICRLGRS